MHVPVLDKLLIAKVAESEEEDEEVSVKARKIEDKENISAAPAFDASFLPFEDDAPKAATPQR